MDPNSPSGPVDPPQLRLASSPSQRVPSSVTIANWPSSILLNIFLHAADVAHQDSQAWAEQPGGSFLPNSVLKPLLSVCRGWKDAATSALYRSIVVATSPAAANLLETLTANPALCGKIKRLALGLSDPRLISQSSEQDLLNSSRLMVRLLSHCHNLNTLQIRPLHEDVAPDLLDALRPLAGTLRSLVIGPDGRRSYGGVTRSFTSDSVEKIVRMLRALETLEINCWAAPKEGENARWEGPKEGEVGRPLRLKQLGISADLDREVFEGLLSECEKLEVLDVYMEREVRLDKTREALRKSTKTLKSLRFFINTTPFAAPSTAVANNAEPPGVLFDETLLPSYAVLERIHLCDNLTSPSIFRHLPLSRSLRHLALHSLAPAQPGSDHFRFTPQMLEDLRDPALTPNVDALETVRIRDVEADWGPSNVQDVRRALEERGVKFVWEEDRDSGSGSGTGTGPGTGTDDRTGSSRTSGGSADGSRRSGGSGGTGRDGQVLSDPPLTLAAVEGEAAGRADEDIGTTEDSSPLMGVTAELSSSLSSG